MPPLSAGGSSGAVKAFSSFTLAILTVASYNGLV
jgi:hypothetical protein